MRTWFPHLLISPTSQRGLDPPCSLAYIDHVSINSGHHGAMKWPLRLRSRRLDMRRLQTRSMVLHKRERERERERKSSLFRVQGSTIRLSFEPVRVPRMLSLWQKICPPFDVIGAQSIGCQLVICRKCHKLKSLQSFSFKFERMFSFWQKFSLIRIIKTNTIILSK